MDVDIAGLEAILSPYIVLLDDAGVHYVSTALARRLGVVDDEIRDHFEKIPEFSSQERISLL